MAAPAPRPTMNKAFTREAERDDQDDDDAAGAGAAAPPPGTRNYHAVGAGACAPNCPSWFDVERPRVVEVVLWAAKNGDRFGERRLPVRSSGKKRLREIDRRSASDPAARHRRRSPILGPPATTRSSSARRSPTCARIGREQTVTIKGRRSRLSLAGEVSWVSPIARALLKRASATKCSSSRRPAPGVIEVVDAR